MPQEASDQIEGLEPKKLFEAAMPAATPDPLAAKRLAEEELRLRSEIVERLPELDLGELLGRGGMGWVFRARQRRLDREVALKVVAPEPEHQAEFARRFEREAQALARLNHPNLVAIYDYGQDESFGWLIMEYVDGSNLRDLIRAGKLAPAEALALVPKICDALQFAHDQGVVHRDIKPENILLDRAGGVKVTDFGLAKFAGTPAALVTLTGAQQVLGTFRYMAPEQLDRPLEVDHRADIYSLGVVLYELLTGEIPMGRFEPPSRRSEAPEALDGVVLRALEKEPDQRYQQAVEVKTDLESAARGEAPQGALPAPEDRARRHLPRAQDNPYGSPILDAVSRVTGRMEDLAAGGEGLPKGPGADVTRAFLKLILGVLSAMDALVNGLSHCMRRLAGTKSGAKSSTSDSDRPTLSVQAAVAPALVLFGIFMVAWRWSMWLSSHTARQFGPGDRVMLMLVLPLVLVTAGVLGWSALRRIRLDWPRKYGAGGAIIGAWGGLLVTANLISLFLTYRLFWDSPSSSSALEDLWISPLRNLGGLGIAESPRGQVEMLLAVVALLVVDTLAVIWLRKRFLMRCKADQAGAPVEAGQAAGNTTGS